MTERSRGRVSDANAELLAKKSKGRSIEEIYLNLKLREKEMMLEREYIEKLVC